MDQVVMYTHNIWTHRKPQFQTVPALVKPNRDELPSAAMENAASIIVEQIPDLKVPYYTPVDVYTQQPRQFPISSREPNMEKETRNRE